MSLDGYGAPGYGAFGRSTTRVGERYHALPRFAGAAILFDGAYQLIPFAPVGYRAAAAAAGPLNLALHEL